MVIQVLKFHSFILKAKLTLFFRVRVEVYMHLFKKMFDISMILDKVF